MPPALFQTIVSPIYKQKDLHFGYIPAMTRLQNILYTIPNEHSAIHIPAGWADYVRQDIPNGHPVIYIPAEPQSR